MQNCTSWLLSRCQYCNASNLVMGLISILCTGLTLWNTMYESLGYRFELCECCRVRRCACCMQAERADAHIHSLMVKHDAAWPYHACFSTWTLYNTLHTMIRHCLAGLELELYLPHEYQYIFWLVDPAVSVVFVSPPGQTGPPFSLVATRWSRST